MSVRRCRTCHAPKWASDPCPNADCSSTVKHAPLRARTKPVTAAVKHGFHANATGLLQVTSDYDTPISARSQWRAVRSAS